MSNIIFTGDDVAIPVTIELDGVAVVISLSATIKAILRKGATQIAPATPGSEWTCLSSDTGYAADGSAVTADWPNGIVVVKIPAAATAALDSTKGLTLEIYIDFGTYVTRWETSLDDAIYLRKGIIS